MRAGTIVASNYLEMARLLAESFLDQHPGHTFAILVVDDLPVGDLGGAGDTSEGASADADTGTAEGDGGREFDIVRLGDLDLTEAELDRMKTIYDVMELSTAVKPSFLKLLLADDPIAAYLDPDIFVYAPFAELLAPVETAGIVLTPHVLDPIPRDGTHPNERMIMGSGIFNLGFIGVGRSAIGFLDWWQERLLVDAVSDIEANLFTDQRWIDWVPAIFGCVVLRDPGMNVAWWNIHERDLRVAEPRAERPSRHGDMTGGAVQANGSALRFVHFSGYDPATPELLSKHQQNPRTAHAEGSVIRRLADRYGAALEANGHHERRRTPYQWNTTPSGRDLPGFVRALCRRELLNGERTGTEAGALNTSTPMAFGPDEDRFEDWLSEPIAGSGPIRFTRLEVALYDSRPDLQAAFPQRDGNDAVKFRDWLDHDPSVPETLGDRWVAPDPDQPADDDTSPAPAGLAAPARSFARRAAGKARRELTPYVERARAKVGR
ncbi:hypothetical protein [Ilumatobacter coccineus]|uniref:Uncharacterized protein n=1 Tax=Ilumatobacter coccineus (strain NBRC 103263 / KCTC 29153 / YM16-304) TaxID=1313172 RepID=A0A6C7EAD6_ILUCY|nr:hypothetical protein [Ilumatobacter coccineus]BAN03303.1 hypothetical protein YM304_29890 [Ilumatobacter coccineus YM16-304]